MKNLKDYQITILVVVSILINFIGKHIAITYSLPVWLDSVGTILTAYYLGPVCGAIVGATGNIMYGYMDGIAAAYTVINMLTGIIAGIAADKDRFKNWFEVITVGAAIAIVSTICSTPLNLLVSQGYTSNMWGDGVVNLFKEWNYHPVICYVGGEFYIDFLDKFISVVIVFAIVKLLDKKNKKAIGNTLAILIIAMLFLANGPTVYAASTEGVNYNSYVQTLYGSMDGLIGGVANDIATTKDGVLWIGTYGGLLRYNGTEFERMDNLDSVKNVNCIYVDEEGRMWIGTNGGGLSICINEQVANVIEEKDGLPSGSVRSIACSSDGYYYVGTTDALCVISLSSGIGIEKCIPEIMYAERIATDRDKNVVAVTDAGELFWLRDAEIVEKLETGEEQGYTYTSCGFDENGILYAGTSSDIVELFQIGDGKLQKVGSIECKGIKNIKSIYCDKSGRVFVCSDAGVGYIDNHVFTGINTNGFNSSIDNMTIDYQDNLWFTSSRLGLLSLCRSSFDKVYTEAGLDANVVNSIVRWNNRVYFGTDSGIDVIDYRSKKKVNDNLSILLDTVRVRCLLVDSQNHLWICTSGSGVYEVRDDGSYVVYTEAEGALGNKQRSCMEMSDGSMAVSGDKGITFIKDEQVVETVGKEDGLTNTKILNLSELADGRLAAGSDGAGVFIIDNYKVVDNINKDKGLSSDIILRIKRIDEGTIVVTGNGLCFLDKDMNVSEISSFPYYNNYDVVENGDKFWILSSAGIYIVDRESLIKDELTEYELLDAKKGLKGSITVNAWNYVDEYKNFYFSCDIGANMINMDHYDMKTRSYRMSVKNISVDGVVQSISIGETARIPRGSSKLEIFPELIDYSTNDPYVMYRLDGFDTDYTVVAQSDLTTVTYTNLPSGKYTFQLAVMDDKKEHIVEKLSYTIVKEKEIYDNEWFLVYTAVVFMMAIAWVTWFITKTQIQKTINIQKKELELVRSQLRLGNETVLAIARTVDAKDVNTSQHSFRVSEYSVLIAQKLGFSEEACENLRKTALLHDIGKIGIPDRVLNKPDRLTEEEYEIMKSHVVSGGEILKDFTLVENVCDGAMYHHERYDGKGYVHGLKGEDIPLNARIIGIADAFDAMTANRVYRKKLSFDKVIEEIKKGRGSQFDPKLVDILLDLIENGDIDVESLYEEKA